MCSRKTQSLILEQRPVLFHGTDHRILTMSDAARRDLLMSCRDFCGKAWNVISPHIHEGSMDSLRGDLDDEKHSQMRLGVSMYYNSCIRSSRLFEYGSLYLTSSLDEAWKYAERARHFGETGFMAYGMALALDNAVKVMAEPSSVHTKLPGELVSFIEEEPQPTVVRVDRYEPDLLLTETGEKIKVSKGIVFGSSFRYLGDLDLSRFELLESSWQG